MTKSLYAPVPGRLTPRQAVRLAWEQLLSGGPDESLDSHFVNENDTLEGVRLAEGTYAPMDALVDAVVCHPGFCNQSIEHGHHIWVFDDDGCADFGGVTLRDTPEVRSAVRVVRNRAWGQRSWPPEGMVDDELCQAIADDVARQELTRQALST